jgi:hypothetical protein
MTEPEGRAGDPTSYEWLEAAAARLVARVKDDPEAYRFRDGEIVALLDMAGVAARDGGHKTNAPLLAYLVGLAHGRHPDVELDDLIDAATPRVPAGP